jgi:hypothetical protein
MPTPKKDNLRKRDLKQSRNAANYCVRSLFLNAEIFGLEI